MPAPEPSGPERGSVPSEGPSSGWAAAVLCGGASRRMGADKALVVVDGAPMASRVAGAARAAGAAPVVAVGGARRALADLGLEVVPDDRPGEGPLAAVVTALGALDAAMVLVLGCDLVDPDPRSMEAVVTALRSAPGAHVAVPVDAQGLHQWVHAAWRRSALPILTAQLDRGVRSLRRAGDSLVVVEVSGLAPESLRDADVPEDLPGAG